jgi:hypothetical protein
VNPGSRHRSLCRAPFQRATVRYPGCPPQERRRLEHRYGLCGRALRCGQHRYGTERAGGVWLLEQALNLKSPAIYDTIMTDGKEERVLNQEATLAAREKQKRIKEQFRSWIFADPDRTERLVRLYNDIYNNRSFSNTTCKCLSDKGLLSSVQNFSVTIGKPEEGPSVQQ